MEATVYNQRGEKTGSVKLPERVFAAPWNADLVHQVVVGMRENARRPIAHTKGRNEVRGGGKKPWPQKGTGQARHGSRRSPLWRGGGTTFGPRKEKVYGQKLNKKMRARALYAVLTRKWNDGEILFVDRFDFAAPKTKDAKAALDSLAKIDGFRKLSTKKRNTALIAFADRRTAALKSFRNFGNIATDEVRNLNPVGALSHTYLIIEEPDKAIPFLAERAGRRP